MSLEHVEGSNIIASSLQCFDNIPAKESASTNNKVEKFEMQIENCSISTCVNSPPHGAVIPHYHHVHRSSNSIDKYHITVQEASNFLGL